MLYLKSCTKCGGDMYEDKDSYGAFHQCLQCGLIRDLDAPSMLLTKQLQDEVSRAKRVRRSKRTSKVAAA